jgi:hypothetical protein
MSKNGLQPQALASIPVYALKLEQITRGIVLKAAARSSARELSMPGKFPRKAKKMSAEAKHIIVTLFSGGFGQNIKMRGN